MRRDERVRSVMRREVGAAGMAPNHAAPADAVSLDRRANASGFDLAVLASYGA